MPTDIFPNGINPAGAMVGTCATATDPTFVFIGFLRAPGGTFATINVPGSASTFVGSGDGEPFTGPPINASGAVTGFYSDASGLNHGFVRAPDGTFTTFDAPGAVNGTAFLCCITPEGAIAGISFDANFFGHGFLRAPNGTFTSFDAPGSVTTAPTGINPSGVMSGVYFDANFGEHGFVRARDGTITTFDAPGAGPAGTEPDGINPAGAIVGGYADGITFHGFLRARDGTFTTVDPPGSAAVEFVGPINPAGVIAGSYFDASEADHGFLFLPRP
jgi:hypothetical protein